MGYLGFPIHIDYVREDIDVCLFLEWARCFNVGHQKLDTELKKRLNEKPSRGGHHFYDRFYVNLDIPELYTQKS